MKSTKPQALTTALINKFFEVGEKKGYTEALELMPSLSETNVSTPSESNGKIILFFAARLGYAKAIRFLGNQGVRASSTSIAHPCILQLKMGIQRQ